MPENHSPGHDELQRHVTCYLHETQTMMSTTEMTQLLIEVRAKMIALNVAPGHDGVREALRAVLCSRQVRTWLKDNARLNPQRARGADPDPA